VAAGDNDALSSPGAKRTGAAASAVASPQAQKSSKKTALGGKIETLANQRAVPITTRDQVRGETPPILLVARPVAHASLHRVSLYRKYVEGVLHTM
jgi:hypothetical protein